MNRLNHAIFAALTVLALLLSFGTAANAGGKRTSGEKALSPVTSGGITFERKEILVGSKALTVEIADTDDRRERGLMERTKLSDKEGMLFIFQTPRVLSFWMKNTLIPLSIGFFSENGKLFQITDMEPASPMDLSPKIYNSAKQAKYALEVPKGWFARKRVELGAALVSPSLGLDPAPKK